MESFESTLAIIKPEAVENGHTGAIIELIEQNGFSIVGMFKIMLAAEQVAEFYAAHKERSFFPEMLEYMSSGPVVVMHLAKEDAIKDWRALMGATDPEKASVGTIRRMFGTDIGRNAVHGSDSPEASRVEIGFFFEECC